MSKISNGEGFIYVYPCIMGGTKNLCKIGVTDYGFLVLKEEVKVDTTKPVFEALRDKILSKYNDELPEELLLLLRDVEEFKTHCSSHYETGNLSNFVMA